MIALWSRRGALVCHRLAPSHGAIETELCARLSPDSEDCGLVEVAGAIIEILAVNDDYGDSGGGGEAAGH